MNPAEEQIDQQRFTFASEPHGEGGFGKIIKGRDKALERDIAVKLLNPLLTRFEEGERERFQARSKSLGPSFTSEHSINL